MKRPFDAIQSEILEKFTQALFHDVEMVITPDQVVENIQTQFALIEDRRIHFGRIERREAKAGETGDVGQDARDKRGKTAFVAGQIDTSEDDFLLAVFDNVLNGRNNRIGG